MTQDGFLHRPASFIDAEQYGQYAVLVPLVATGAGWSLLLEKRSAKLARQPLEICFPGGRVEPDEQPLTCAVRETAEELQMKAEQVEVLGPGDIYLSPFRSIVYPYIGVIRDYRMTFNPDEVSGVLLIPLEYFQRHQPDLHTIKLNRRFPDNFPHHLIPGGELYPWPDILYKIYFYLYNEHVIWGMTSHILKSAVELIAAADLLAGLRG